MYSIAGRIPLNYNEQRALEGIIQEVTNKYPVKKIILYGSKARGDFVEGSDIDLLFVAEGSLERPTKFQMGDIIYEYEVSHDVVVSAIFVSESELREKINIFFIISYEGEKRGY
jgi:predicted nucleotidyltransferase